MFPTITVTITGDKDLHAKLKRLGSKLDDYSGAMKDIGRSLASYYAGEAFASQGGVYGEVWAPLSPSYAIAKAKKYPGRGLLVRTGKMQQGFTATTNSHSALITNKVSYYKYHQSPEEPRTRIPRRKMAGVNEEVIKRVTTIIQEDVADKIRSL